MSGRIESGLLMEICRDVKESEKITCEQISRLSDLLGSRFDNALKIVEQNKVKLYVFDPSGRRVWIVVGKSQDYQILPNAEFCACDDYYFKVIGGKAPLCYHLIAQKLAEALGKFNLIRESDEKYEIIAKRRMG
jgi:predicted nucleic acid-binding Zn finger protein